MAADTEGRLQAVQAFGLAGLDDLACQEAHQDVEQEGGVGAALPHASADAETFQI